MAGSNSQVGFVCAIIRKSFISDVEIFVGFSNVGFHGMLFVYISFLEWEPVIIRIKVYYCYVSRMTNDKQVTF